MEIRCTCQGGAYPCSIATCGNVHVCPVCSAKIRTRRSVEVEAGSAAWIAAGGDLAILTLTVRHHDWMTLGSVLGAVMGSWRTLQYRKEYRALRKLLGGTVRALEVTVGDNGWHPHIHVLLFVLPGVDRSEVDELVASLFDPWAAMAQGALGVSPDRVHGLDLTWVDEQSAAYVAKLGREIASADTKGTRHPFTLLDEGSEGDAEAIGRFLEYADGMRGRQSLAWSKGLRDRLGLNVELSDEELAAEDEGGELVEMLSAGEWNGLVESGRAAEYLRHVERRMALRKENDG